MKNKIIFTIMFLQTLAAFSQLNIAQQGTPVKGIIPIKRSTTLNVPQDLTARPAPTDPSPGPTGPDDTGGGTPIPIPTPTIPSSLTGTSSEVGITEGQLSVSLTGSASYSIPIATPPGINGIVPQIALTYNSQGGNGLAGYGWNISGLSIITRIPSTKFHDDTIDGVDFNNLDRFAFDGQRIMVKNGTSGLYGADGTVYETENFSTVKMFFNLTKSYVRK